MIEELKKKYNVIKIEITPYSDRDLWIHAHQSVTQKQYDGSVSHSHISHQFKAVNMDDAYQNLEKRAKAFYDAFQTL